MIPELGHFALILATVVALIQGVMPLTGTYLSSRTLQITLQSLARPMAILQFVLVALSFAALAVAFLTNDFSVTYVAQHSNSLLPKPYQLSELGEALRRCLG